MYLSVRVSLCVCVFRACVEEKWGKAIRIYTAAEALDGDNGAGLDPSANSTTTHHTVQHVYTETQTSNKSNATRCITTLTRVLNVLCGDTGKHKKKAEEQKTAATKLHVKQAKEDAIEFIKLNDWAQAEGLLKKALRDDEKLLGGKQAELLLKLKAQAETGASLREAGLAEREEDWHEAVAKYKEALGLDPEDVGKQDLQKLLKKAEKAAKKDEVYPWQ